MANMPRLAGIKTEGADTYGAEYARSHPEDLPDGFVANVRIRMGRRYYKTGEDFTIEGIVCKVVAGKQQVALVLDTRKASAEDLDYSFPVGRLLRWNGLYWRVFSIRGVFVQLECWGTKRRRQGWRLSVEKGREFARPVEATNLRLE